jgi:LPXTG-motif cell wall-anchored protein
VSLALAAFALPSAALAQYGGEDEEIVLTDSDGDTTNSFTAGEQGTANVSGLEEDTDYDLDFEQSPGIIIGSGTSDGDGDLTINFRIPTTATVGSATLTFIPDGGTTGPSTTIQIVAGGGAALPDTGQAIDLYIGLGIVLILLGTVLVLAVRNRRTRRRVAEPVESEDFALRSG